MTSIHDTFSPEEQTGALATLGQSELGDRRLTTPLVARAARWAPPMGHTLTACCNGNTAPHTAPQSGSYRFLRSEAVDSDIIAEGAFEATIRQIEASQQLTGPLGHHDSQLPACGR